MRKILIFQIKEETKNMTEMQIVDYCLNFTSKKLQFDRL